MYMSTSAICNLLLRFAVVVGLPSARKGKWILELLRMLSIHHLDSKDQNAVFRVKCQ